MTVMKIIITVALTLLSLTIPSVVMAKESRDPKQTVNTVSAVEPGLVTVKVDGESIDFFNPGSPAYTYTSQNYFGYDGMDDAEFHKFHWINLGGKKFNRIGRWSVVQNDFYLSEKTGMLINPGFGQEAEYHVSTVVRDVNGTPQVFKEVKLGSDYDIVTLVSVDGTIELNAVSELTYSSPDHVIRYKRMVPGTIRRVQGAIFLRDSTLNVPAEFAEVAYDVDKVSGQWRPYVRKQLFGEMLPYTPGMDSTPQYNNDGEKNANEGYHNSAVYYYATRDTTYSFSRRDLAILNHAAVEDARNNTLWEKHDLDVVNPGERQARWKLEQWGFNTYANCLILAIEVNDFAEKHTDDEAVREYAAQSKHMLSAQKDESDRLVARYVKEVRANMDQYIKADKYKAEADARRGKRLDEQAKARVKEQKKLAKQRRREYQRDNSSFNESNAMIALAILGSVNRTLATVFGGGRNQTSSNQGFRVIYTPGTSSGYGGGGVSGADQNSSTSSGSAKVSTPRKCTACSGSGACPACRRHPGKATAASKSLDCHGCHGSCRCSACGGSGFAGS